MSKTVFEPTITSRPVYGTLAPRDGTFHLFVADAEGAEAILEMAADAPDEFFSAADIMFIVKDTGDIYQDKLKALNPLQHYFVPTYEACVSKLRRILTNVRMGTQVYLSGTEGLMGQAMREAMDAGIPMKAIQTEHRGSTARRMQCVHCKGITEDVTTDPFQCSHCGLHLFVRDHYSRRIAAFQGVCIDAEDPGNVPESVEVFK